MRFEQLKTLIRSLRFRLTAWNTAVVFCTVIVTLVGVREALQLTFLRETRQLLLDDTLEIGLAVEQLYPDMKQIYDGMERKSNGHIDRDLFVQLLDPHGKPLWSSRKMPPLADIELPAPDAPTVSDVGKYQMAQRRLHKEGVPGFVVRVGSSLAMVQDDVVKLTQLMTAAGVVILFIAPLGGYWLARRATSPLTRIINTAARLRPTHIQERLPIRKTGDELDQLSQTINRFLDLIAEYLERNRAFLDNAAHELRSPLAAIQSSVEVALNANRSIEEYQDLLGEISDQCGHLSALVNQLLLLAETDAARLQVKRRPVRLDRLVEQSLEMFRGTAEERGIELASHYTGSLTIQADGDRLRQLVNNLIDNSIKFTPRGGSVVVSIDTDPQTRHTVLCVRDTGAGIDPADLPHVFERFYRGDKSRNREAVAAGNGLGLSICQSIVAAHGGTINVESTLGQGTTFTVCMPVVASTSSEEAEPARLSYTA